MRALSLPVKSLCIGMASHSISRLSHGLLRIRVPKDKVTIFYGSCTKAHGTDFRTIAEPAVMRVMGSHEHARFLACGYVDISRLAQAFPGRVTHIPLEPDRDAYLSILMLADINISVLT